MMKGEDIANRIAKELCSVQPMPNSALKDLYEGGKSVEELKKEGYKPVSRIGLVWVKDDSEEKA